MALMPVGFSIFLAKGFVPAITSEGRVVNASLFVIVVIIIGVQWVILNLAALLHRGIRHCEKHHQLVDAVNNVIS